MADGRWPDGLDGSLASQPRIAASCTLLHCIKLYIGQTAGAMLDYSYIIYNREPINYYLSPHTVNMSTSYFFWPFIISKKARSANMNFFLKNRYPIQYKINIIY